MVLRMLTSTGLCRMQQVKCSEYVGAVSLTL